MAVKSCDADIGLAPSGALPVRSDNKQKMVLVKRKMVITTKYGFTFDVLGVRDMFLFWEEAGAANAICY
jgi:hypothetical protein